MKERIIIAALSCALLMPAWPACSCAAEEAEATDNGLWAETDVPVSVRYDRLDESYVSAESEDPEQIASLIDAIRMLKVGELNDMETLDQGDYLTFTFEDGREVYLEFEGDNLVTEDKERYAVEGLEKLHTIFDEMYDPENKAHWKEDEDMKLKIGDTEVSVIWEDNVSVKELKALLPLEIKMSMYGGFEQVGSIGQSLTRDDKQTTTQPGDIMLYSGDQIVIFYGSNSWAYTPLGHIISSQREMEELLGAGDVTVTIY